MCLEYDEIKAYLHYYAGKFQSKRFEHDELVNEAWMIVHKLNHIGFASQGIRWAMWSYISKEHAKAHKGNRKAVVCSIEKEYKFTELLIKDIITDPKKYNQNIEDSDLVKVILNKSKLRMDEIILIDQLYFRGWTQKRIADLRGCTRQNINLKLERILDKITRVAMREVA